MKKVILAYSGGLDTEAENKKWQEVLRNNSF